MKHIIIQWLVWTNLKTKRTHFSSNFDESVDHDFVCREWHLNRIFFSINKSSITNSVKTLILIYFERWRFSNLRQSNNNLNWHDVISIKAQQIEATRIYLVSFRYEWFAQKRLRIKFAFRLNSIEFFASGLTSPVISIIIFSMSSICWTSISGVI